MNDFQKAIDTITKAFEEFAAKLKEMADTVFVKFFMCFFIPKTACIR